MRQAARLAVALCLAALPARAADFTDDGGRKVALPATVERVFPAGPPASIELFILAPAKMVGWTAALRPAEAAFVPAAAALPAVGRLTGRGGTVDLETLVRDRPDLVLDVGTVGPTYVSLADRVQRQTGIPYALIGGGLADTPATLKRLGALLGVGPRGDALARYAADELAELQRRIATVPAAERPRVYVARGPRGLSTDRSGSLNAQSLDLLGARNVVPPGPGNLAEVSMEQVLAWQPDAIVTVDADFFNAVWRDPLWQKVGAVAAKRVYLSPRLPFPWFEEPPAANRLLGLRWLAKLLYPRLFPEDLRAEARRFYALFYQRTPSDRQLDELLAAGGPPG